MNEVMRHALKQLKIGLFVFFCCLIVCIKLRPNGFLKNVGISYFGISLKTIIPYAIGFGAVVRAFHRLAGALEPHRQLSALRNLILIAMICTAGVLLTPDTFSYGIGGLHMIFAGTLFLVQLVIAIALSYKLAPSASRQAATVLMVAAGVVCFLSLMNVLRVEMPAQIIFQSLFSYVLISSFGRILYYYQTDARDLEELAGH